MHWKWRWNRKDSRRYLVRTTDKRSSFTRDNVLAPLKKQGAHISMDDNGRRDNDAREFLDFLE